MNRSVLIVLGSVLAIALLGFFMILGQRLYHNRKRKLETVNTFAIQNVATGMNIRPYNAGIADEIKIIQFKHHNWECMT